MNAMRNTARYNPPVFDRPEGSLHDWEIFSALGERVATRLGLEPGPIKPPHELIDAGLRAGPYGEARGSDHALSLEKLQQHPSGIDLGPLRPQLPERLFTADGMIHCAPAAAMADLARLRRRHLDTDAPGQLRLIGRRHVRSNNSWMHNYQRLVKGRDRCTLLVHPADLEARGLGDGERAELASRAGSLGVILESSTDIMPGVVSLPHGYGHDRDGIRMQTARANAGVSCNDITDDRFLDGLSGNAAVNGVPVTLTAAR